MDGVVFLLEATPAGKFSLKVTLRFSANLKLIVRESPKSLVWKIVKQWKLNNIMQGSAWVTKIIKKAEL